MNKNVRGFRNKTLIIIPVFILIAISYLLIARFVLVNKSPREFYLESEGKNFRKYSEQIKNAYRVFYENQKPYMDSRYKNRVELTAQISSDSEKPFGLPNAGDIFDIIGRCKLVASSNYNPAAKESLTNISLLLEGTPLVDAETFTRGGRLSFSAPVFLPERYFSLNLDKIDEVYDRFYKRYNLPPFKPKRVLRAVDIAKAINYSDEEFDRIIKDYGSFISGLISEKDVKYGKSVSLKIGSEVKYGKEVMVTLGSDGTKKLFQGLADKISADDALLKITYGNYADVLKLFDEAGFFQLAGLLNKSRIDIKKDLNGFKNSIREYAENTGYPGGIKMTLIIDKSGNILDRKVDTTLLQSNGAKRMIGIHTGTTDIKNGNFKNGFCTFNLSSVSADGTKLSCTWDVVTKITPLSKNGDEKGSIKMDYTWEKNDIVGFGARINLDIGSKTDELTLRKNSVVKYDAELKSGSSGQTDTFNGEISTVSWQNNKQKTKNANTVFIINADLPSLDLKNTALKLNLAREDRFDIDFSIPEVQAVNTIDLNNITDSGLVRVENEMMASFGTFYLNNKPIIDAITAK